MKENTLEIITSKKFQKIYKILGVLFIILTLFISITPDSFMMFGYLGIFVYNIVSSSLLIMPILVERFNIYLLVLVSALGNIPNTSINYFLGATSNTLFSRNKYVLMLKKFMNKFGLIAVYILAIVPIPVDINGLLSGYLGIPYRKFVLVSFLGKVTIFTLAAYGVVTLDKITTSGE